MVKLGDIAVTANSFIPDHAVQLVETYSDVNDRSGQELKGILDTEGTKASAAQPSCQCPHGLGTLTRINLLIS